MIDNVVEVRHVDLTDVVEDCEGELYYWVQQKIEEDVPMSAIIGMLHKTATMLIFWDEE